MDGWGELYPSLFWIFGICLTLQSPLSLKVARHAFLPSSLKDTSPIHINLASRRLNSITVSLISSCPCVLSEIWTLSTSTLSSVYLSAFCLPLCGPRLPPRCLSSLFCWPSVLNVAYNSTDFSPLAPPFPPPSYTPGAPPVSLGIDPK